MKFEEITADTLPGFPLGTWEQETGVIQAPAGVIHSRPGVIAITPEMTPVSRISSNNAQR